MRTLVEPLAILLPFPPSVNKYWVPVGGGQTETRRNRERQAWADKLGVDQPETKKKPPPRLIRSEAGNRYRDLAVTMCMAQQVANSNITEKIDAVVYYIIRDQYPRDNDNFVKAPFDGLTAANVWEDDRQVLRHRVEFVAAEKAKNCLIITLERYEPRPVPALIRETWTKWNQLL